MRLFLLVTLIISTSSFSKEKTWFPFKPSAALGTSEIILQDWNDKPAGKHGFVQMQGENFVFEDGTPVKFWGANIASERPFMQADEAKIWASFLSNYGFNGVRFHKFTWDATDGIHSTTITPEKWKNFDFLCHELRNKGIYYGWSHIYGHRVLRADSSRVIAYKEIAATKFPWSHLNATTSALVNFADDLQELNIELTINMLNHINPLTGLRYAEDPALSFIEFQNEDDIFWAAIEETLKQTPTYRKLLCKKFSMWLKEKYKTEEALKKAWNNEGLAEGESLAGENIYPQPNHGLFSWEYDQAIKENRNVKRHYLDKICFLYEEQLKFYKKFEKAIRNTGYKGALVGSCWQAGSGTTHLLNLNADFQTGIIDRHNYFGGGQGHELKPGNFSNEAMVSKIGSGLFSTGMQQVSNRPFQISEWMSLIPNEWTAESAPIIATYGMGLQGWDASYVFAVDFPNYTPTIQTPWGGIYNATSPTQLALYPALARMIYRKDVKEGEVAVNRTISIDSLLNGSTFFRENVTQDHDRKSIESSFPMQLMAVGKVMLTFSGENKLEIGKNQEVIKDGCVTSTTSQLQWCEKNKGFFTINTEGTKGLVGFAANKNFILGNLELSTENEFAVIFVSSTEKYRTIENSKKILVTSIARVKNFGMEYNDDHTKLLNNGTGPILIEPVKLKLTLKNKPDFKVSILDHNGNRTGNALKSYKGSINLDGEQTKAIYYLIEF